MTKTSCQKDLILVSILQKSPIFTQIPKIKCERWELSLHTKLLMLCIYIQINVAYVRLPVTMILTRIPNLQHSFPTLSFPLPPYSYMFYPISSRSTTHHIFKTHYYYLLLHTYYYSFSSVSIAHYIFKMHRLIF